MGVRVLDSLIPLGQGQRLGIFAGSGVGKSSLLGMIARGSKAQVNIICLVGERGREVQEFVHDHLGDALQHSVVVVTTSDRPALERIKALAVATTIAEEFRDRGQHVLLMCDSLTRLAMAQRELGLATGEPPATRGYPPSVWATLPQLLERAGSVRGSGSITGLYTVLVEGDDMNEPIADAARAILDGHVVLSRDLAHQNHYPAVDVLQSVSRLQGQLLSPEVLAAAGNLRELLAAYSERRDMIALGAYQAGTEPLVDRAIELHQETEQWLCQSPSDLVSAQQSDQSLLDLLEENILQPEPETGIEPPLLPTLGSEL
jgi:flagellum-specific ATP synthase